MEIWTPDGLEIKQYPLVQIDTKKLVFDKSNPHKSTEAKDRGLEHGMKRFGNVVPIVVDQHFKVVDGQRRAKTYMKNGLKQIPGYQVKLGDDIERRLLRQLLNYSYAETDALKYAEDLKAIFEGGKLDDLSKLLAESKEYFEHLMERKDLFQFGQDDDFDIDTALEEPPIVQPGEIWALGDHKLMCGDCTNPDHVKILLKGLTVDQLNTDPPFGVDYGEKTGYLKAFNKSNRKVRASIKNDKKSDVQDYRKFFASFLKHIPWSAYNTGYIFMSGQELHSLRLALEDVGMKWSDYLIWSKNQPVLGRKDYNAQHEFIVYGWKGKHKFFGSHASTVLEFPKPQKSELHPTMKPIPLVARLIKDGTSEGMVVYDPFGGSGSSLMACEQTGRISRTMEAEPRYCDVIIRRWQQATERKAAKVGHSS